MAPLCPLTAAYIANHSFTKYTGTVTVLSLAQLRSSIFTFLLLLFHTSVYYIAKDPLNEALVFLLHLNLIIIKQGKETLIVVGNIKHVNFE